MCGAGFPPCCLTWGRTIVEVMQIVIAATKLKDTYSFKESYDQPK